MGRLRLFVLETLMFFVQFRVLAAYALAMLGGFFMSLVQGFLALSFWGPFTPSILAGLAGLGLLALSRLIP